MKKIILSLDNNGSRQKYPILIGTDLIAEIETLLDLKKYSKALIITDSVIEPLLLNRVKASLSIPTDSIVLPPSEQAKKIDNVQKIWEALQKTRSDRKSLIINLGGGVIGDVGAFAASTYMRGIDFIQIPTSLLAQVDASVGGKTGIDFAGVKNLIGTFNQPIGVVIDMQTLKTLPKREFLSGFAEIIKHGLIADKEYFKRVTEKTPTKFSQEELIDIIHRSCEIKADVVQKDQKEGNLRKILNFGHTVGHAIEAISLEGTSPLLHGEAITIGMIAEARISQLIGNISETDIKKVQEVFENAGLPTKISSLNIDEIMSKMKSDKKNEKGNINFTLLKEIGRAVINQTVPDEIIKKSLQFVTKNT